MRMRILLSILLPLCSAAPLDIAHEDNKMDTKAHDDRTHSREGSNTADHARVQKSISLSEIQMGDINLGSFAGDDMSISIGHQLEIGAHGHTGHAHAANTHEHKSRGQDPYVHDTGISTATIPITTSTTTPGGISTATIPTTTSTTPPGAWRRKNEADCWYKCGSKDGSCPTFCGVGGFCCRKGYGGCPAGAAEASPKYHTCVIQIGVTNDEEDKEDEEEAVKAEEGTKNKIKCVEKFDYDTDYKGGDISDGGNVKSNNKEDCRNICRDRTGCKFWTFVESWRNNCLLKYSSEGKTKNSGMVSGNVCKGNCPAGWTSLTTGCYKLTDRGNQQQAATNCRSSGGFLAEIDSQEEHNAVTSFNQENVWLGATDAAKDGEWVWSHSGKKITFNNWNAGTGEPNGGTRENCLEGNSHGGSTWNDKSCSSMSMSMRGLCELGLEAPNGYTAKNGDCPGNDIWELYREESSLAECSQLCNFSPQCQAFMLFNQRTCYPKTKSCVIPTQEDPLNIFYSKTACKADEKISGSACLCQGTSCDIGGICAGGNTCTSACKADEKISGSACLCQGTSCDIGGICAGGNTCTPASCEVKVGSSDSKTTSATVSEGCVCPVVVNKGNWLGEDTHGVEFNVTQDGSSLHVERTDSDVGWEMDLSFECHPGCPADIAVGGDCMCAGIRCATGSTCVGGSTCTVGPCASGWTSLETGCYMHVQAGSFPEAKANCKKQGGYLVEIYSQEEQDAMFQFSQKSMSKTKIMIGGSDEEKEGEWKGKHTEQIMKFTAWHGSEPGGKTAENCIIAYPKQQLKWHDYPCSMSFNDAAAICEQSPVCVIDDNVPLKDECFCQKEVEGHLCPKDHFCSNDGCLHKDFFFWFLG